MQEGSFDGAAPPSSDTPHRASPSLPLCPGVRLSGPGRVVLPMDASPPPFPPTGPDRDKGSRVRPGALFLCLLYSGPLRNC